MNELSTEPAKNRLEDLRKAAGLERSDLAVALGVTEDTIRRFERERTHPIPSKYIPALAHLVKADERHLMGWDRTDSKAGAAA